MAIIHKKIWPESFERILDGSKTWELRLGNLEISPGDILALEEFDPETQKYTGRKIQKKAGYIRKFRADELPFWSKEEIEKHGLQVISLLER